MFVSALVAAGVLVLFYYSCKSESEMHIVMFKTEWCPHSRDALPTFKELSHSLDGTIVNNKRLYFHIVDIELDEENIVVTNDNFQMNVRLKYLYAYNKIAKIHAFPTYVLYDIASDPMYYTGPLERNSILAFLKNDTI